MKNELIKGVAYHGNRMLNHTRSDMQELAESGFNAVLHVFSHNDWDRHKNIMGEIFSISEYYGLDVWVDNWGLAGPPGDKSHFLSYHPEAHQMRSDGSMDPIRVCLNSEAFVKFTKLWIDTVYEAGGRKIFWDEPHLPANKVNDEFVWTCHCPVCKKLFEEHYNMPMPTLFTPEVQEFRKWTISNYFQTVSSYAKEKGMYNSICLMFEFDRSVMDYGVDLDSICSAVALDNIGSDPYWVASVSGYADTYKFVYEKTKHNLDICKKYKKEHNIWIQTYENPANCEEDILASADAIYDAGARTIFAWGFRGSDASDYRSRCPERAWYATKAAFERISERHRNAQRDAVRKEMGL